MQVALSLLNEQLGQYELVDMIEDRARQWTLRRNLITQLDSSGRLRFSLLCFAMN